MFLALKRVWAFTKTPKLTMKSKGNLKQYKYYK